jgi:hypothetical protein
MLTIDLSSFLRYTVTLKNTLSEGNGGWEGFGNKSTLCALVKILIIMDDPEVLTLGKEKTLMYTLKIYQIKVIHLWHVTMR